MDSRVINQEFGHNWAFYNGDCVIVMRGLPENSVDFNVHSPPFLALYIYSDSVADLGNSESEAQFFEGYQFAIREMYRVQRPGRYLAVHCKDTMRYMSSHGYAGLYDFPGEIIRVYEAEGFLFQRWITIFKDPVVEMQRTKTYGLLHKSFVERAEVTRQGCADYILIFQKPFSDSETFIETDHLPSFLPDIFERIRHLWSQEGEEVGFNQPARHLSVWSNPLRYYTPDFIEALSKQAEPGRLCVVHCKPLLAAGDKGGLARIDMMGEVIRLFEAQGNWRFHSRCALTDGSFLVAFRNWRGEFESGAIKHALKAPRVESWHVIRRIAERIETVENGTVREIGREKESVVEWREPTIKGTEIHPDYIGTQPPTNWHDDSYYSILVWQKYASPVWFDLAGLPPSHRDIWMDINQTNVLNARLVRREEDEKHICPLQLDLIERLIAEYTRPDEIVLSPYGGIGSEGYQAVKMNRRAVIAELKTAYWQYAVKTMKELEIELGQFDLFSLAGLQVGQILNERF